MPQYKMMRLRLEDWETIKALADDLSARRGSIVTRPQAVVEAVKFYHKHKGKT